MNHRRTSTTAIDSKEGNNLGANPAELLAKCDGSSKIVPIFRPVIVIYGKDIRVLNLDNDSGE